MNKFELKTSVARTVLAKLRLNIKLVLLLIFFAVAKEAFALLTIEIKKGELVGGIPIAVVPFALEGVGAIDHKPADIIEVDLDFSGKFDTLPRAVFAGDPSDLKSVQYQQWRLTKVDAIVIGKVINLGEDQLEVRFRLVDIVRKQQIVGQKFTVHASKIRKVAHQISDIIYQQLTGEAGAFDTMIAYVAVTGTDQDRHFYLQVADADGFGTKTVLSSTEPILSPTWSPDGNLLAYVTFEKVQSITRPIIYVQNIWSGERKPIARHPGLNSAPSWSPDGNSLALTLSKEGNPEIFIYTLNTDSLQRLTRHTAIDTEPSWSPDGRSIVFSSGRSGAPQVYRIPVAGGAAKRLTFNGNYNADPSYSPDGKSIVMITEQGNGFRVGLYSDKDRIVKELTTTTQDESPTFSPNGEMIMYATQHGGRGVLATVSKDGSRQQTLKFQNGAIREPAWSPLKRKKRKL